MRLVFKTMCDEAKNVYSWLEIKCCQINSSNWVICILMLNFTGQKQWFLICLHFEWMTIWFFLKATWRVNSLLVGDKIILLIAFPSQFNVYKCSYDKNKTAEHLINSSLFLAANRSFHNLNPDLMDRTLRLKTNYSKKVKKPTMKKEMLLSTSQMACNCRSISSDYLNS